MAGLMPDSRLNGAERALQLSFRKSPIFNNLLIGVVVLLAYLPIRGLPDRKERPVAVLPVEFRRVDLPPVRRPLVLAGAWVLSAADPRFAGLSGLALDRGRFLAVSDVGAVLRFDPPSAAGPVVTVRDLRIGPGAFGSKWSRDAESVARDRHGRGWWVGYEQSHSLWLYGDRFEGALAAVDVQAQNWRDNRGAEGLLAYPGRLLVAAENGRDAIDIRPGSIRRWPLDAGAEVADAAVAPDGSSWLLLRSKGFRGISQSIAPLVHDESGYRAGRRWPLPKGPFDNYEGMAIEQLTDGRWRFWLVTDDGHRLMARTLLVALDFVPARHVESPASVGPSQESEAEMP